MKLSKLTRLTLAGMMTCTMALTTITTMSAAAPVTVSATPTPSETDTMPATVTMKVHKLKVVEATGPIINTGLDLGLTNDTVPGVEFVGYQIRELFDQIKIDKNKNNEEAAEYIATHWQTLKADDDYKELIKSVNEGDPVTTDANGVANFGALDTKVEAGQTNKSYALYLFEELSGTANVNMLLSTPIIAGFPIKNPTTEKHLTTVNLYAKNSSLEKKLDTDNGISADGAVYNYEVGETIKYTATAHVPMHLSRHSSFEIADELSHLGVTLKSLKVYAAGSDVTQMLTDAGVLTLQQATDQKAGFTLSLPDLAASAVQNVITAIEGKSLTFEYEVVINEDAVPTQDINNKFVVTLDDDSIQTVSPKIETGGFQFKKIDSTDDKPLSGAKFVIQQVQDGQTKYAKFTVSGLTGNDWVTEDGEYRPSDIEWVANKDQATRVTSATDGNILVTGLKSGNYHLEEVASPHGYVMLTAPVDFTIEDGKLDYIDIEGQTREIENTPDDGLLPITGSTGIAAFLILGTAAMGTAVMIKKRRA